MKFKISLFVFCFLFINLVSSVTVNDYSPIKEDRYEVVSASDMEALYNIKFSNPDRDGMIDISMCLENETRVVEDYPVSRSWYERIFAILLLDFSPYRYVNYSYVAPRDMPIRLSEDDREQPELLRKRNIGLTPEICYEYSANPFEKPYLKFGNNSIVIIQGTKWSTKSRLVNISVEGNGSHISVDPFNFSGLMLYYPFDLDPNDKATFTAYDWWSDNDATGENDTTSTEDGCLFGKCLRVDGAGDYLLDLSTDLVDTNLTTIAFWLYPFSAGGGNQGRILVIANGPTVSNIEIYFETSSGNINILKDWDGGANSLWRSLHPHQVFPIGQWNHFTMVYNSTDPLTNATFYKNGLAYNPEWWKRIYVPSGTPVEFNNPRIKIGAGLSATTRDSNFTMDELMIFNRLLDADEVYRLYENASTKFYKTGTQKISPIIDTGNNRLNLTIDYETLFSTNVSARIGQMNATYDLTDLITYLNMEWCVVGDTGAFEVIDLMGYIDGDTTGSNMECTQTGLNSTQGIKFPGEVLNWVTWNDANRAWNTTSDYSYCLWVNPVADDDMEFLSLTDPGNNPKDQFYYDNYFNTLYFNGSTNGGFSSTGTMVVNGWNHICFTYEGQQSENDNGNLSVFRDGDIKGSIIMNLTTISTLNMKAGANDTSAVANNFNGTMDNIMLFNRTLSNAEITQIFDDQAQALDAEYYYTPYQNLTGVNMSYTTSSSADFKWADFLFYSNVLEVYSPIIRDDLIMSSWNVAGAAPEDCWTEMGAGLTYVPVDCLYHWLGGQFIN